MKITSVEIIALEKDRGNGSLYILCRVNTDEGINGLGEAGVAIATGATAAFQLLKDLAPMIVGLNPLYNEMIWEKLFKQSFGVQGNDAILMAAISAIDIALWDIKGKAANLPLYALLGGKQRDKLRCYASQRQFAWQVGGYNPGKTDCPEPAFYTEMALRAKAEGFTAIKANFLKYNADGSGLHYQNATSNISRDTLRLAEARLAATREALGPDADIIIENHAMTDADTAIQFGKIAAAYDIMFLEEPTPSLNPAVFRRIRDKIDIPLATGERTYTRWGFLPFFENQSLSVIQPDIANCGGITEAKKICDLAYLWDVSVQTHVCSSPISVAVSAHLEAAIPNFIIHEHHVGNTIPSCTELVKYDYSAKDGYLPIPELPGIGQELSDKALESAHVEVIK
jgi:L-alanine-DL-glutamate epimerase-like enolase superfamily enzyme